MKIKMILKYLSYLLLLEAVFMLPAAFCALFYSERTVLLPFLITAGICAVLGLCLFLPLRKYKAPFYIRESFVVAGLGWILLSLFGSLPFYLSGEIPSFLDAFFETVSGFTTTGATILTDVEALSRGLLFWRSLTHWLGGVGVLAFVLVLVKGSGGFAINLMRAEMPGPQVGKLRPRVQSSAKIILITYLSLSALNLAMLLFGGMPVFDALCTMFGTAGTGGFSIKNAGLGAYSQYIQIVSTVFMLLFGINFTLYYMLFRGDIKGVIKDEELRLYLGTVLFATVFIMVSLHEAGFGSIGKSLHNASFSVSSIITTTGFNISDFDMWPGFARAVLIALMIFGAMAGSTGGGFKCMRVLIVFKSIRSGLYRLSHPRSVRPVKLNGKSLDEQVVKGVSLFLGMSCAVLLGSFLLVSLDNQSFEANFSAVFSCFNNIGPVFGMAENPNTFTAFSPLSKLVLSLNMLIGRLEIFPIIILFLPSTWRMKA